MTAPLLVFGWGNLSCGDDALGPLFVQQLSEWVGFEPGLEVDFLEDYQLQVEHALDLVGRERVLFVDASLGCKAPFEARALQPRRDSSFTTHAFSPESVMHAYSDLLHTEPPPCTLLAIRGMKFELGDPPGGLALEHLAQALAWARHWLKSEDLQERVTGEGVHA